MVRTGELVAAGVPSSTVADRVTAGLWARPHHGVIDVTQQEWDWARRVLAAVLANPRGTVASHGTAAALHGLPGFRQSGRIEITTPRRARTSAVPYVVHSTTRTDPAAMVVDAVPCFGGLRTALGLATSQPDRVLARAVRELLRRGMLTADDVADGELDAMPGIARLRRAVVHEREAAMLKVESPLEEEIIDRLLAIDGLPVFTTQTELRIAGTLIRPDILWQAQRVVLEVDGGRWHADHLAATADDERQQRLEAAGWTVVRVSAVDLATPVAWARVVERLRSALSF